LQEWIVLYGGNVAGADVILIIGHWAAMAIRGLVRKWLQRNHVEDTPISFAASLPYAVVLACVIIAALAKPGIQTASFIAEWTPPDGILKGGPFISSTPCEQGRRGKQC
jgi:hypothetical protein